MKLLTALALVLVTMPAQAQLQPGPNIIRGLPYTYSPRAGYLGPPVPIVRGVPPPVAAMAPPATAQVTAVGHNGSIMEMTTDPASGLFRIVYAQPKPSLAAIGVVPGTLLIDGRMNPPQVPGPQVQATARVYDRMCGAVPYPVIGHYNGPIMTLEGPAPTVWAGTCAIAEYIWTHNSYLRFELLH